MDGASHRSQRLIIPMLWVSRHFKYYHFYSAGIDFRRQNLTSKVDPRIVRSKTVMDCDSAIMLFVVQVVGILLHVFAHVTCDPVNDLPDLWSFILQTYGALVQQGTTIYHIFISEQK